MKNQAAKVNNKRNICICFTIFDYDGNFYDKTKIRLRLFFEIRYIRNQQLMHTSLFCICVKILFIYLYLY